MELIYLWIIALVLGYWIFKTINQWRGLPPGPWGLPIFGYLPYIDRNYPHLTVTKLSKQYGPIYGLQMGSIYTVVLSDHRLIREAFSKDVFAGRAPLYLTHGIMKGKGIICTEGALWKDQRKMITTWLKSLGMSKHGTSRENLMKRISNDAHEMLQNIKDTGAPISLDSFITHSIGNIVNELVFGCKFPIGDKTWSCLTELQEAGCHELNVAGVVNFLPFVRFISPSLQKTMQMIYHGQSQSFRIYASIIATRRKMLGLEIPETYKVREYADILSENHEGVIKFTSTHTSKEEVHYFDPKVLIHSDSDSILDNFLREQKRRYENGEENAINMRDEQLYYLLGDMFGAGLDTTTASMAWFILYMALNIEEQAKVRKEILTVHPEVSEIDISKLSYLTAAIYETQRIRSIVPTGLPHGCVQETFLEKYRIPKGSMILPLQWAIHMDPNTWEDPDVFKPSRFIDQYGELIKPQEFIPFQTGKRMCPGDELSRMIMIAHIVPLFRNFKISLESAPTPEELLGKVGLTLAPPKVSYICQPISQITHIYFV